MFIERGEGARRRLKSSVAANGHEFSLLRTPNTVTLLFKDPDTPIRHLQVSLGIYQTVEQVLANFDLECCCVAFDGENVLALPCGKRAFDKRTCVLSCTAPLNLVSS